MATPETPDAGSEEAKRDSPSSPLIAPPDTSSSVGLFHPSWVTYQE